MHLRRKPFMTLISFFTLMVIIGAIPGEANALSARFGDKSLHVVAYAFISLLANRSLTGTDGTRSVRAIASVMLVGSLGLLDESIQRFLPYRNASLLDWCFDIAAAFAVTSLFWLRDRSPTRTTQPETSHAKKDQQGRLSSCRARHAVSASHQGQSERDAAGGG